MFDYLRTEDFTDPPDSRIKEVVSGYFTTYTGGNLEDKKHEWLLPLLLALYRVGHRHGRKSMGVK